jgi:hypothetical protein
MRLPSPSKELSSDPVAVYRTAAKSPLPPALLAVPTRTIFPSGWIATARAKSPTPIPSLRFPSESNETSGTPALVYRATAKSVSEPLDAHPASTIFPSPWIAIASAWSSLARIGSVRITPPLKVLSSEPSRLYRATAKSSGAPFVIHPAATIFPSGWIATAAQCPSVLVSLRMPSPSNEVSSAPFGV